MYGNPNPNSKGNPNLNPRPYPMSNPKPKLTLPDTNQRRFV